MKKIMLSLILGVLVLGFVAASMSGMAVSVSEKEAKAFSFQEKDYSVEVQNQDDGTVDLEINGEKVEDVEEGDVVVVNGAEVEVTNVRKPWFFRRSHKVDLNVVEVESTQVGFEEGVNYRGFLAETKNKELLKNYKVEYNEEGNLIYEMKMVQGTLGIYVGEEYEIQEGFNGNIFVKDPNTGEIIKSTSCHHNCGKEASTCAKTTIIENGYAYTACRGTCSVCKMIEIKKVDENLY